MLDRAALSRIADEFSALADTLTALGTAAQAQEHAHVLELLSDSRSTRLQMSGQLEALRAHVPRSSEEAASMERIARALPRIALGSQEIARWMQTTRLSEEELLTTPNGTSFLAETILKPTWFPAFDIQVLLDTGGGGLEKALVALGQRRLIAYLPEDPTDLPREVMVAGSTAELRRVILNYAGEPPNSANTRALPDPHVTPALLKEVAAVVAETLEVATGVRPDPDPTEATRVERALANLPALAKHPSATALRFAFRGKPCIVVGAGPSLVKNAATLRGLVGRALVLAAPNALPMLAQAGVVADFAIVAEDEELPLSHPVRAIAAVPSAHPAVFGRGAAIVSVPGQAGIDDRMAEIFGDRTRIFGGPSATTAALRLALFWGSDPIVLVGHDLEPTCFEFQLQERWFQDTAINLKGRVRLLNCTEGGARLEGFEDLPLSQFVAQLGALLQGTRDLATILDEAARTTPERRERARTATSQRLGSIDPLLAELRNGLAVCKKAQEKPSLISRVREAKIAFDLALAQCPLVTYAKAFALDQIQKKLTAAKSVEEELTYTVELFHSALATAKALKAQLLQSQKALL